MFEVLVEPGDMDAGAYESDALVVVGRICVRLNGGLFPNAEWSDFPVVILGWWLDCAGELWRGERVQGEFRFMDGPWSVRVQVENRICDLFVVEHLAPARLLARAAAPLRNVCWAVLSAAEQVLGECHRRGWVSPDIEYLRNQVCTLKRHLGEA